MPGRPNSVCGSCGWSARRRRRRHDRSERKRPRSAAIRPTRNAPEMAYAATASPPSSNFPRADLRVTHTHRRVRGPSTTPTPAALEDARVL
jgi:hypothetical protein